MPLPYTEETVRHVAERIRQVQEILERTILIENVSSYMAFRSSRLEEWEFLKPWLKRPTVPSCSISTTSS